MTDERNPFVRYKRREGLTYAEMARRLQISPDYLRKLGCGSVRSVSPAMARHLEVTSEGKLQATAIMDWVLDNTPEPEVDPNRVCA